MSRINLLLLLILLASSLMLVKTTYDARRLFAAVERSRGEERLLEVEFKRLDAERQAQSTHGRVERVAREQLQMRGATPGVTHYVVETATSPAGASAASGAAR